MIQPLAPQQSPNPMRWSPLPEPNTQSDFVEGLVHVATSHLNHCYLYQCHHSMQDRYFVNQDGELLFIPYLGALILHTEFGQLTIDVGMIAVIPRGIVFKVELISPYAA